MEWNKAIKESRPSDLPQPLTPEDELLKMCGVYHMADGPEMVDRYVETLRVMEQTAPKFRDLQFIKVRLSRNSPQNYISLAWINTRFRAARRMNSAPRRLVSSGRRNTTSLTNSGVVARTDSSMQAPGSISQTR